MKRTIVLLVSIVGAFLFSSNVQAIVLFSNGTAVRCVDYSGTPRECTSSFYSSSAFTNIGLYGLALPTTPIVGTPTFFCFESPYTQTKSGVVLTVGLSNGGGGFTGDTMLFLSPFVAGANCKQVPPSWTASYLNAASPHTITVHGTYDGLLSDFRINANTLSIATMFVEGDRSNLDILIPATNGNTMLTNFGPVDVLGQCNETPTHVNILERNNTTGSALNDSYFDVSCNAERFPLQIFSSPTTTKAVFITATDTDEFVRRFFYVSSGYMPPDFTNPLSTSTATGTFGFLQDYGLRILTGRPFLYYLQIAGAIGRALSHPIPENLLDNIRFPISVSYFGDNNHATSSIDLPGITTSTLSLIPSSTISAWRPVTTIVFTAGFLVFLWGIKRILGL